ncbi:hypothetical protein ONZ45_g18881 [Pleurotus djamor]|nr:hypothetical protein ONZ45_g18881 [Pleurotus djamor]
MKYITTPPPRHATRMSFSIPKLTPVKCAKQIQFDRRRIEQNFGRTPVTTGNEQNLEQASGDGDESIERERQPQGPSGQASAEPASGGKSSGKGANDGGTTKIPKPSGEPGRRPETGGWPLKDQLVIHQGWAEDDFSSIYAETKKAASAILDTTVSYHSQNSAAVTSICKKLVEMWPMLSKYEDCWPVRSMLKVFLKYTSERARQMRGK